MFLNTELFPTPKEVIDLMLEPYVYKPSAEMLERRPEWSREKQLDGRYRILDPSAGTGSILSHIQKEYDKQGAYGRWSNTYFAIEIEPDLRAILKEKGFNPIGFDFLEFQPDQYFDLVVMNPPFSEGVDHLLHAWDILPHGDIVCLLNAETINNPYSKKRQLLAEIIETYGRVEFFGPCFANAERPTQVEVACVWLNKPAKESAFNFGKDRFDFEPDHGEIGYEASAELARPGIIDALVDQYQAARLALINVHRAKAKYGYYTRNISSLKTEKEKEVSKQKVSQAAMTIDKEIGELRKRFWKHIFMKTKVMDHTTSNFHKKIEELEAESGGLAFNKENIFALLELFMTNSQQIMEECICDVFDTMTDYHEGNKVWFEGWKTNSAHRVNQKIIIPDRANFIGWNGWQYRQYENRWLWPNLDDLDKMLCWVMGLAHDDVVFINEAISQHCDAVKAGDVLYREKFVSSFFEIRIYKKGTVHLKFRDTSVWEKFNGRVAEIRKWIPPMEEDGDDLPPWDIEEDDTRISDQMALVLA